MSSDSQQSGWKTCLTVTPGRLGVRGSSLNVAHFGRPGCLVPQRATGPSKAISCHKRQPKGDTREYQGTGMDSALAGFSCVSADHEVTGDGLPKLRTRVRFPSPALSRRRRSGPPRACAGLRPIAIGHTPSCHTRATPRGAFSATETENAAHMRLSQVPWAIPERSSELQLRAVSTMTTWSGWPSTCTRCWTWACP